jgi:hypothetical protein
MRTLAVGALLCTLIAAPQAQDDPRAEYSNAAERSFAPGGTVRLDLSAGDYRVRNGADNRIRVAWHTGSSDDLQEAKVHLTVHGTEARIETSGPGGPGRNTFRVEIELPRRTHLNLQMTAGDISAQAFGYSTGGLFRSFTHEGKGPFELYARLWAGDLRLLARKSAQ